MPRLILIRHSMPEVAEDRPSHQWALSAEGQRRASILGVAVAAMKPASLHSSAEAKATQTAEAITLTTGLTLNIEPDFNEHDRSNELFVSKEEFENSVSEALLAPDKQIYGSETIAQSVERFENALLEAEKFSPPGDIAVVSHGTVISGYIASKVDIEVIGFWKSLGLPGLIALNWPDPDKIELRQNFE